MTSTTQILIYIIAIIFLVSGKSFAGPSLLMVTAEQTGVFNTGGLGHTTQGLAKALKKAGYAVDVLMPRYSNLDPEVESKIVNEDFHYRVFWGEPPNKTEYHFDLQSYENKESGVKTYFLKSVSPVDLFSNKRNPNEPLKYTHHPNEVEAFAIFNKAAAAFISRRRYEIINTHDWHSGLVGKFIKEYGLPGAIDIRQRRVFFTISNLGYQGLTPWANVKPSGLNPAYMSPDNYEFYGQFNMMKAGILDADAVLTVSDNYLKEIYTERFGHGLSGFLREQSHKKPILAITNGADVEPWIPKDFSAEDLSGKRQGKISLQKDLGFEASAEKPLFIFTSRLAQQKGYDYLTDAIKDFLLKNAQAQVVVMGDGDANYKKDIEKVARENLGRMVYLPFDKNFEKRLNQYADFFVNTPRYEPSGTNQIFALAAGTIPIVSNVGGLPNYIQDEMNGYLAKIKFKEDSEDVELEKTKSEITSTLLKAARIFHEEPSRHQALMRAALRSNNTWDSRIPQYQKFLRQLRESPNHYDRSFYQCRKTFETW